MLFFNFWLFHFSKFQMTIVKFLMEKPSFLKTDFEGSYEVLLSHKYFWSTHFLHWNDDPYKIFRELHFVSLFFLNERNITTSLLIIHLKSTAVHYVNLNSSSINKLNMLFRSFRFLTYVSFNEVFVKKNYEKIIIFWYNFQNLFQDVVYCSILGCQTLWY